MIRRAIIPLTITDTAQSSEIPFDLAYLYPSIRSLSDFIYKLRAGKETQEPLSDRASRIERCVSDLTSNLPSPSVSSSPSPSTLPRPTVVALTGTTGSLGCYLLSNLIRQDNVKKVFCLCRGSTEDAERRQYEAFEKRGISQALHRIRTKVEFVSIDLSRPSLDIEPATLVRVSRISLLKVYMFTFPQDSLRCHTFHPSCLGAQLQLDDGAIHPGPHLRSATSH